MYEYYLLSMNKIIFFIFYLIAIFFSFSMRYMQLQVNLVINTTIIFVIIERELVMSRNLLLSEILRVKVSSF